MQDAHLRRLFFRLLRRRLGLPTLPLIAEGAIALGRVFRAVATLASGSSSSSSAFCPCTGGLVFAPAPGPVVADTRSSPSTAPALPPSAFPRSRTSPRLYSSRLSSSSSSSPLGHASRCSRRRQSPIQTRISSSDLRRLSPGSQHHLSRSYDHPFAPLKAPRRSLTH